MVILFNLQSWCIYLEVTVKVPSQAQTLTGVGVGLRPAVTTSICLSVNLIILLWAAALLWAPVNTTVSALEIWAPVNATVSALEIWAPVNATVSALEIP